MLREPVAFPEMTEDVRARLALAVDVDDRVAAVRLVRELKPYFGVAKIGLELFCAGGPDAVAAIADEGLDVFLDLKLHDIPTTVNRAAAVAGALGARYLTLHAQGGAVMLRAGVDGMRDGAARAELPEPVPLAVTILTSDDGAPKHVLPMRIAAAVEAGCGGVVCAATDVAEAKLLAPRLTAVVPGIRPAGSDVDDQRRVATPAAAFAAGADLLVDRARGDAAPTIA